MDSSGSIAISALFHFVPTQDSLISVKSECHFTSSASSAGGYALAPRLSARTIAGTAIAKQTVAIVAMATNRHVDGVFMMIPLSFPALVRTDSAAHGMKNRPYANGSSGAFAGLASCSLFDPKGVARVSVAGIAKLETVAVVAFATLRIGRLLKATRLSYSQLALLSVFALFVTAHNLSCPPHNPDRN
jgi:hypothetical protein